MESNTRRYKRFTIDFMKINGRITYAKSVDIIDISVGGISLRTDKRLNPGNEYALKIEGIDKSISVKGTVIWASLHESRKSDSGDITPLYSVGIKFSDVSSEKISELVDFIESHKEKEVPGAAYNLGGIRFHMRFHLNSGKTILTCPEPYKVKKISEGGILIESKTPLALEQRLPMNVYLPGSRSLSFLGRVATCILRKDTYPEEYEIGIEFMNMPKDDSTTLNEFILKLNHPEDPL